MDSSKSYGSISEWDTSRVTNMSQLFLDATYFDHDISKWDVSSVTSMKDTFYFSTSLNGDIGQWDVSKVISMKGMFAGVWSLIPILTIGMSVM